MGTLKEQIRESYFNPVLQMLPALTFIVAHYVWGLEAGWWCSVGITLALTLYVHKAYRGLFGWFMLHMLLLLVMAGALRMFASDLLGDTKQQLLLLIIGVLTLGLSILGIRLHLYVILVPLGALMTGHAAAEEKEA